MVDIKTSAKIRYGEAIAATEKPQASLLWEMTGYPASPTLRVD
jgi:hypothetical protein